MHATALLAFLLLVAAFNLWVDPYRIWRISGGYSQMHPRPRTSQQLPLFKERALDWRQPVTLILGNSRAEIGFNTSSPAWPENTRPVFNAAIPGSGIGRSVETLARSSEHVRLRNAVIGLEFLDFIVDRSTTSPPQASPEDQTASVTRAGQSASSNAIVDARLLLSLDTLFDSIITLYKRNDQHSPDITLDGFNPLREYELSAAQEGYGTLFLQRDTENARMYARLPRQIFVGISKSSDSWRALDRLIALARTKHLNVKFVIYPYHVHILEMFREAGLMPAFEQWKRHLVEVISHAERFDATPCRLWDFSGYHDFAKEQVPAVGDRTATMQWYWESGHFKRQLGDLMLARMFGNADNSFGACLTPENIEERIAALRRDQDRYAAENPRELDAVSKLVRDRMRVDPKP